jgi:hypothetical protein
MLSMVKQFLQAINVSLNEPSYFNLSEHQNNLKETKEFLI